MVRLQTEFAPVPPSTNDLMALANVIREASLREPPVPEPARREVRRSADIAAPLRAKMRFSPVPSPKEGTDASGLRIREQESDDEEDKE